MNYELIKGKKNFVKLRAFFVELRVIKLTRRTTKDARRTTKNYGLSIMKKLWIYSNPSAGAGCTCPYCRNTRNIPSGQVCNTETILHT
jgi:predicted nucleic acid-binding protein